MPDFRHFENVLAENLRRIAAALPPLPLPPVNGRRRLDPAQALPPHHAQSTAATPEAPASETPQTEWID